MFSAKCRQVLKQIGGIHIVEVMLDRLRLLCSPAHCKVTINNIDKFVQSYVRVKTPSSIPLLISAFMNYIINRSTSPN